MKKFISFAILLILLVAAYFISIKLRDSQLGYPSTPIKTSIVSDSYKEHSFVWSSGGFYSGDALKKATQSGDTFIKNAQPVEQPEWKYVESKKYDSREEIWAVNNDTYLFKGGGGILGSIFDQYTIYRNSEKLFTHKVNYGAEGPLVQKAIINNDPAFSFRTDCPDENYLHCQYDIYYKGEFLTEKFQVTSANYLFSYNNKLGFIVETENGNAIYFDGKIISNSYDEIHYQNCCAVFELIPTVYNNGVLVFYAKKNNQDYVVEIDLSKLD